MKHLSASPSKLGRQSCWVPCLCRRHVCSIQRYVARGIFWLSTERLSRSTSYLKEGGEGTLYSYTLQSCKCDVLHRRLGADSDKISDGGISTYILHLSGSILLKERNCWETGVKSVILFRAAAVSERALQRHVPGGHLLHHQTGHRLSVS